MKNRYQITVKITQRMELLIDAVDETEALNTAAKNSGETYNEDAETLIKRRDLVDETIYSVKEI